MASTKTPEGSIYLIGGTDAETFNVNAEKLLGTEGKNDLLTKMYEALVTGIQPPMPTSQAVANVQQQFPQSQQDDQWSGTNTVPGPARSQQGSAPRPAAGAPPGQGAPVCAHGYAREFKSGTSQKGNEYKGWFCVMPRGQSCPPQYLGR